MLWMPTLQRRKSQVPTEYVILKREADVQGAEANWKDIGKRTAASGKAAVAALVKEQGLEKGIFCAVPARSFTPIRVQAEQKVRLKFS